MAAWGTTNKPSTTGKPSTGKKVKDAVAKPGEALQGQFSRAREEARQRRHEQLVTVVSSLADDVRTGLRPTQGGNPVTASRAVPAALNRLNSDAFTQRIATANGRLVGWSLVNVSANFVLVRFRAGRDADGDIIAVTRLDSYATSTVRVGGPGGVWFGEDGLTMQVNGGGQVEGSVHIGEVD